MTAQPDLEPLDEKWQRAMAIVAHPDDLEYGAASAVARWTSQGKEVTYVMVTRGEAGIDGMDPETCARVRCEEECRSAAAVGVTTVEFLDHADGTVEYGLPLRRDLARMIRRHRPEVLVAANFQLTWGNRYVNMADHRAVGMAALDAARDAGNRWEFRDLRDEGLEPWSGVRMVCFNASPDSSHAVDVTEYLARGVASLQEHRAYIAGLGGDFDADAFLRGGAESVGKRAGCELAVSFEVFRV
ncbi:MAG: PIG-L family deacetylase [Chloroflexota bacterium]